VDFVDDALTSEVTAAHVDAMMRVLRRLGVTRVSWGYYGDGHGGFFVPGGLNDRWRNGLSRLGCPFS